MSIFGIGPTQIAIIAVAALIIFGPGKLPEVMGQAGKLLRDFRGMTNQLTGEFEKTMAEARSMTEDFNKEVGGMTNQVNSVTDSVKRDLGVNDKRRTGSGTRSTSGSKSNSTRKSGSGAGSKAGSNRGSRSSAAKNRASGTKGNSTASTGSRKGAGKTSSKATENESEAHGAPPKEVRKRNQKTPVASKEDPVADVSLFEPAPIERRKRARRATPGVISDPTPRPSLLGSMNGHDPEQSLTEDLPDVATPDAAAPVNDALARARARRRQAGYSRHQLSA